MAVYKRDIVDINLETGNIHRTFLNHSIGMKDQKADHFGVRVFRDGEPVNLTGVSVQGVFMPPQGSPIAITSGNIVSENVAEVVLPQACYNYDGQFTLAIKLVDSTNEVTGTVRIIDGMVDNTHASGTVAPTSAVPTYQEVLSAYEQAIAVIGYSVRFDQSQSLTDTQKETARTNIGAVSTADMNAALALKVNVSDIENDLTGTTAGKVLDARQGKVLDDKVSDVKSAINDTTKAIYDAHLVSNLSVEKIGHYTVATNGTLVSNDGYDTFAVNTTAIKSFKLTGSTIKVAGYYGHVPVLNDVAIDGTRHLDLPQGDTTVPNGCNCLILSVLTGDSTSMTATTGAETINEKLNVLDDFLGISIDGYEKEKTLISQTVDGEYIDFGGTIQTLDTTAYAYAEVESGKEYYISGVGSTGGRLYVCKNSNGIVIDVYQSEQPTAHINYKYIAPIGAHTLYVNTVKSMVETPSISSASFDFITSGMAIPLSATQFRIPAGDYLYGVDLEGSQNKTFTYTSFYRNGTQFKAVGDDITPIVINTVGNVGANHGYIWSYDCEISSHGYTESDIGKTYNDGTNTFVLMQVKDSNHIVVGCYDSSAWFKLKRVAPTSVNFGSLKTVTSSTLSQFYPSVKNRESKLLENGNEKCSFLDTYDIIDMGSGLDAIIQNAGSNTNDSIAELANSIMRVRCIYEFHKNGSCTVYSNWAIKKSDLNINYLYAGTQSMPFGGNDKFCVPETNYKTMTGISGSQIDFSRTGWDDQTKPPFIYIQFDQATPTKSFISGYLNNDGRNAELSNAAGFYGTTGKMYPYFVQPLSSYNAKKVINTIAYRIPAIVGEITGIDVCAYCYLHNDIYLFLATLSEKDRSITLPDELNNKQAEIIMSDGLTVKNTVVVDQLDIVSSGVGYAVVRLY